MTFNDYLLAPSHLALSSGFFGFYSHAATSAALWEAGYRPSSISGASAGALIGCLLACGLSSNAIAERLSLLQRSDFWRPGIGLGLLKPDGFKATLRQLVPQRRFEDTETPFSVSVYSVKERGTKVISSGDLIDGVFASCAIPFLFHPQRMRGDLLWDGGIKDRPGVAGVPDDGELLYLHIPSKSPWRRHVPLPERVRTTRLAVHGLPRSGPSKLALGPTIYGLAYQAVLAQMQRPYESVLNIDAETR
ncbi:patatin-like phospholipase family protein [Umboniibacter marinipuniceus]|uniref:NTE family protein n=1 Tax=Umboniibacter marinipuniceus TaxID=569599 RepID=A0A3M0A4R7_9GAMM|nr:patatin-like phospholipase family protein [Umboniibacter marinipuniceus]RMA80033.1 NTE family protein [Umboniibacter marinipuniceus]